MDHGRGHCIEFSCGEDNPFSKSRPLSLSTLEFKWVSAETGQNAGGRGMGPVKGYHSIGRGGEGAGVKHLSPIRAVGRILHGWVRAPEGVRGYHYPGNFLVILTLTPRLARPLWLAGEAGGRVVPITPPSPAYGPAKCFEKLARQIFSTLKSH